MKPVAAVGYFTSLLLRHKKNHVLWSQAGPSGDPGPVTEKPVIWVCWITVDISFLIWKMGH